MMQCWCGNSNLSTFSPDYYVCNICHTLVLAEKPAENITEVKDEDDFYGKSYWFNHQRKELGLSDIFSRSRSDVPERVVYWLRTFLKYKTPPGKTLEIGCSHGGFVAMLQWAGFQAMGLELSPWVVDFAHNTFNVPMLLGKLEEQQSIEPGTLDAVILMDVLEHLPDPLSTIQAAKKLLKPDGFLFIQTPCYPRDHTYESMLSENHPFLMMLKPPEHIFLFNQSSISQLLEMCGFPVAQFEQAIFSEYDMFLGASATPLTTYRQEEIDESLLAVPSGRLVLALLDKDLECRKLYEHLRESEADRASRWQQIQQYSSWLKESEIDRAARWEQIQQYQTWLRESEANRAAQLEVIKKLEKIISNLNSSLASMKASVFFKLGKRLGLW